MRSAGGKIKKTATATPRKERRGDKGTEEAGYFIFYRFIISKPRSPSLVLPRIVEVCSFFPFIFTASSPAALLLGTHRFFCACFSLPFLSSNHCLPGCAFLPPFSFCFSLPSLSGLSLFPLFQETKIRPSTLLSELTSAPPSSAPAIPRIIEFFNLADTTAATTSAVDINVPLFQPFPAQLVIDEYEPFGVVTRDVFFRNNDNCNRRLKLLQPDSPYFKVSAARSPQGEELKQSSIGAGMEVMFTVTFSPQECREYGCDLVCRTEREKFVIPVRAAGPRPVLDFPDEIDFGCGAVKNVGEKSVIGEFSSFHTSHFSLVSRLFVSFHLTPSLFLLSLSFSPFPSLFSSPLPPPFSLLSPPFSLLPSPFSLLSSHSSSLLSSPLLLF